ncbi:hypothetical protein LK13_24315 [Paenibacillus polymyxa]|nr:hypothetical protein LK13_24315 [Paenibacillus polymyxa]RGL29979.1 hypothetical protein DXC69_23775 [Paenibacillus polymyxa]
MIFSKIKPNLDLLNLAVQVGDTKWQKEITHKLQSLSALQAVLYKEQPEYCSTFNRRHGMSRSGDR